MPADTGRSDTGQGGIAAVIAVLKKRVGWIFLLFAGVLLPLWVFAELADEVHELEQFVFDDPILLKAHAYTGPGMDRFFIFISQLGYEGVILIDVLIVLALLLYRRWREAVFGPSPSVVRPCSTWAASSSSSVTGPACGNRFRRNTPTVSPVAMPWGR